MPGASFVINVNDTAPRKGDDPAFAFGERQLDAHGWNQIDFSFTANAGNPAQPIGRVASGGELSRLMLALRQVLGQHDPLPTSVYDEVDAGISGATADVIGKLLANVAACKQVICVTHLPQVSVYAHAHFYVEKHKQRASVESTVRKLASNERVEEIARMLAASKVTEHARANARVLLTECSTNVDEQGLTMADYDLFTIGGWFGWCPALLVSPRNWARAVAVAEELCLGGTCVNVGCVPKKLMVYCRRVCRGISRRGRLRLAAHLTRRRLGQSSSRVEMPRWRRLNDIYRQILTDAGVTIIEGRARLIDRHTVEIEGKRYRTDKALIATGGWPVKPPIPGAQFTSNSNDLFRWKTQPKRVIVAGGRLHWR